MADAPSAHVKVMGGAAAEAAAIHRRAIQRMRDERAIDTISYERLQKNLQAFHNC